MRGITHLPSSATAATLIVAAALLLHAPAPARAASSATPTAIADSTPPTGAVGGVSNIAVTGSTLMLQLEASDSGSGLSNAEASIDEGATSTYVRLGEGACPEHPSPAPLTAPPAGCPESVSGVTIPINVGDVPGSHQLRVRVTDAAGNTATLVNEQITVRSPAPPGSNVVIIGIGNPGDGGGSAAGGAAGSGGVAGFSGGGSPAGGSAACRSPLLSMRLASKPLRYGRQRVPVLRAGRRYRFTGRLTCLPAGARRRVSAPNGTVVKVLSMVNRRIVKAGRSTMTVHGGNLSALLGFASARTIVFRYTLGNGENLQVKIPIKTTSKRPRAATRR